MTLYEKLGGEAAVDAAVDIFYGHVLADPRVNYWFEGVDMKKQAAHQKAFLTMAFGGPHAYSGRDMRIGHAHLVKRGLNDSHFDAIADNLRRTLEELNVAEDAIKEVLDLVESLRDDVLNKPRKRSGSATAEAG
jgi:hemoglobin